MAYSTSALIDSILKKAKEPSYPRSEVLDDIQKTQDSVLGRWRFKFNESRVVISLASGAVTLQPVEQLQQSIQLILTHPDHPDPIILEYLSNVEFFEKYPAPESRPAGVPCHYTDFGGEIYLDRPLDQASSAGLRFIKASSRLTDTTDSVPQIPEEFSDILVKGGQAGIEEYRENFDIAALHERRIEQLSEDMLGRYGLRKMQPGKARPMRRKNSEW